MKNYLGILLVAVLACAGITGVVQAVGPNGSGAPEKSVAFSTAITAGTLATVMTATTAIAHNVRSIVITNTASGFVRLYSGGTTPVGANLIGAFGVIANTPLVVPEDTLGRGIITTVGDALMCDATTGTVSLQVRVREDPVSPR